MMKRFLTFFLAALLLVGSVSTECLAIEPSTISQIEYLEDGSYVITTIEEIGTRATNTKTGSAVKRKYDSNNVLEWTITLTGTFTYTGSSSTCTSSSISVAISDSNFAEVSRSATKSGNTAYGSATIRKKVLGVTVSTNTYDLSLSCDKNGNLS